MKTRTRHIVIATIVMISVIVIGCVYYMYGQPSTMKATTNPSTTNPSNTATIDPRTNLTKVIKGITQKFETSRPSQDITQEWSNLIELVKDITKKPVSLCVDMPSTNDGGTSKTVSLMYILATNTVYVTKGAFKVAAENGNFYDIAALFFQEMKVLTDKSPIINPAYDKSGQLSVLSLYDLDNDKNPTIMTIKNFLNIFNNSISIKDVLSDGTDPDFKSFAEKMVPFYNEFVPTLKNMNQSTYIFDVNLFGKLMVCFQLIVMKDKSEFLKFNACTSNKIL